MTSTRLSLTITLCVLAGAARAGADDDPQIQAHIIREAEAVLSAVGGIDQKFSAAKANPPTFRKMLKSGMHATQLFRVNTAAFNLEATKWKPCSTLRSSFDYIKVASAYLFLKPSELRVSSREAYEQNLAMNLEKLGKAVGDCADILAKAKAP